MTKTKTSSKKKTSTTAEGKQPTPEEIKKHKQELKAFYESELPLIKLQADYEEAITRIDVAKMQRLEIMYAKAQMMAPAEDEEVSQDQPRERRLKTQV